eukprot:Nk52_evm15s376 gene=Nk52_evmTU15s376
MGKGEGDPPQERNLEDDSREGNPEDTPTASETNERELFRKDLKALSRIVSDLHQNRHVCAQGFEGEKQIKDARKYLQRLVSRVKVFKEPTAARVQQFDQPATGCSASGIPHQ